MRLNDVTYEYIKQAVADMLVYCDAKGLPIDVFEITTKLGITVIPYSSLDEEVFHEALGYSEDGYSIETIEGEWIIYYNDTIEKEKRINQTIMHEVGHYFLGHTEEGETEESEAKFFAKYALASPVLIQNMKTSKTVENVINEFGIGYQAAVIALGNYYKRFTYGPKDYTSYEIQIIKQLEIKIV